MSAPAKSTSQFEEGSPNVLKELSTAHHKEYSSQGTKKKGYQSSISATDNVNSSLCLRLKYSTNNKKKKTNRNNHMASHTGVHYFLTLGLD